MAEVSGALYWQNRSSPASHNQAEGSLFVPYTAWRGTTIPPVALQYSLASLSWSSPRSCFLSCPNACNAAAKRSKIVAALRTLPVLCMNSPSVGVVAGGESTMDVLFSGKTFRRMGGCCVTGSHTQAAL